MITFMQSYREGSITNPLKQIDDWVDEWHENKGLGMHLFEYLGMSEIQYNLWLTSPSNLIAIINE